MRAQLLLMQHLSAVAAPRFPPFVVCRHTRHSRSHTGAKRARTSTIAWPEHLRTVSDETKPGTQKITWRTFIAKNQGLISDGIFETIIPKLSDASIELPEEKMQVIAKLRYEYALNFIQRVGSSVSRVGLG